MRQPPCRGLPRGTRTARRAIRPGPGLVGQRRCGDAAAARTRARAVSDNTAAAENVAAPARPRPARGLQCWQTQPTNGPADHRRAERERGIDRHHATRAARVCRPDLHVPVRGSSRRTPPAHRREPTRSSNVSSRRQRGPRTISAIPSSAPVPNHSARGRVGAQGRRERTITVPAPRIAISNPAQTRAARGTCRAPMSVRNVGKL